MWKSSTGDARVPARPPSWACSAATTRCLESTAAAGGAVVAVLTPAAIPVAVEVGTLLAAGFAVVSVAVLAVVGGDGGLSIW